MKSTFLFFRDDGFYPVEIPHESLQDNITLNPGTQLVRRVIDGSASPLVWTRDDGWIDKELEKQQVPKP